MKGKWKSPVPSNLEIQLDKLREVSRFASNPESQVSTLWNHGSTFEALDSPLRHMCVSKFPLICVFSIFYFGTYF